MKIVLRSILSTLSLGLCCFGISTHALAQPSWAAHLSQSVVHVTGCDNEKQVCHQSTGFIVSQPNIVFTTYERFVSEQDRRLTDSFKVRFVSGEERQARMLVVDPLLNLGVLILKPSDTSLAQPKPLKPARGVSVSPGDPVYAMVAPQGEAVWGSVKKKNRATLYDKGMGDLFINIEIEMPAIGLGGPLFTERGELIGINTAAIPAALAEVVTHDEEHALPMSVIMSYYKALVRYPTFDMPWIGVAYRNLRIKERQEMNQRHSSTKGLMVDFVWKDGLGSQSGFQVGDIIVRVDGESINNQYQLDKYLFDAGVDKSLKIKVLRNAKLIDINIHTEKRPSWAAL
ncbi:S1C family serine protease [Vibrio sp. SCSIO 43136]|uniref:S1C family serine protease n=1 Tax=Vibrio sp. SCSIO 43136 TaxID=2819101 RepID=UPI002074B512|nr:S1C family serine protease [Vibrio sp. SCSIO 43136]USD67501.1 serine protease [Vibrio sp. SCSIO 43136]